MHQARVISNSINHKKPLKDGCTIYQTKRNNFPMVPSVTFWLYFLRNVLDGSTCVVFQNISQFLLLFFHFHLDWNYWGANQGNLVCMAGHLTTIPMSFDTNTKKNSILTLIDSLLCNMVAFYKIHQCPSINELKTFLSPGKDLFK